jgi:hypothetical protein
MYWALLFGLISLVAAGATMGSASLLARVVAGVIAAGAFVVFNSVRCPKCRLHVWGGVYGWGSAVKPECPRCGRSRKGVWPFQYLTTRREYEAWRASPKDAC